LPTDHLPRTHKVRLTPGTRASRGRAFLLFFSVAAGVLASAACRQDMHDQPKYRPLRESAFFADRLSARPVVEGTVARGHLDDDELLETGKQNGTVSAVFPFPVNQRVMSRGQERYNIYCAPCHATTGLGDGMVVRRGYRRPPAFGDRRLREMPVGHFVDVMTNGFGAMPDYAVQLRPEDRWAVAAYIRALQLSASATLADVPEPQRSKLKAERQ